MLDIHLLIVHVVKHGSRQAGASTSQGQLLSSPRMFDEMRERQPLPFGIHAYHVPAGQ